MVRLYMEFKRNLATEIEKKIIAITPVEKIPSLKNHQIFLKATQNLLFLLKLSLKKNILKMFLFNEYNSMHTIKARKNEFVLLK